MVGRVVFPPDLPEQFVVSQPTLGPPGPRLRAAATTQHSPDKRTTYDEVLTLMHVVPLQPDGSFRVEDVLPGEYVLSLRLQEHDPSARGMFGAGAVIGSIHLPVTIPPIPGGQTVEPLDLGDLPLTRPERKN